MTGPLRLAVKYVMYHRLKTMILIACIFLTAFLPLALNTLLIQFNQKIVARADNTPAIVGALGAEFDLALHGLYFKNSPPDTIKYSEVDRIRDTGLALAIPIYSRFTVTARKTALESTPPKFPIVGTSLDYFDVRNLQIDRGNMLVTLGDCVVGAALAERMGVEPGDRLLSDRENVFYIAGLPPLSMNVRGILKPSRTQDDWSVFVDVKTAWVIQGLGHGHQDAATIDENNRLNKKIDDEIVAAPSIRPYLEITESNIDSFHFHGEMADFPISAILIFANDKKAETLLLGQYDTDIEYAQMLIPIDVVRELMQTVFQIRKFFYLNAALISVSTLLLLVLVVMLSLRLRQREMETMFKIGCSRWTIVMLQVWELGIIFLAAGSLVFVAISVTGIYAGDIVQSLLIG